MTKNTTKKEPKKTAKKYTLLELVNESEIKPSIISMELSRKGLLKQLEYEINNPKLDIKPSMTKTEFNKIMNGE